MRRLLLAYLAAALLSPEGGARDFRQEVNFTIHVTLDDTRHELNAFQTVEYVNNSPDSLDVLFFHLWPNAWSGNNTRLARQITGSAGRQRLFEDDRLRGYIDSLDFRVNGVRTEWHLVSGSPDICRILLNEPVIPGDTIFITTPFRVKIPDGRISHLGHIGQSYQVTHWHPRPAVYDLHGWHPVSFVDMPGIRSEPGSYDVSITIPENYVTGATGALQTEREIRWLNLVAADTLWKLTYLFAGTRFPPSSEKTKTIRFTAGRVPDFAWFADKRFNVIKNAVILPGSGREITTWLMFTNLQARLWIDAPEYVKSGLVYLSEKAGDYPYENLTLVQSILGAGPGRGYPGIAVTGFENDGRFLEESIFRNISVNWLGTAPGSAGSGWFGSPFLDGGLALAFTSEYISEKYPERKLWEVNPGNRRLAEFMGIETIPLERIDELEWLTLERMNLLPALDNPSPGNYDLPADHINFYKAARGIYYLKSYLGDSLFDHAVRSWYRDRQVNTPGDYFGEFLAACTGRDLDWFFSDFAGTNKHLDYRTVRFEGQRVLIENKAEMASPVIVAGMKGDTVVFGKWVEGFTGRKWVELPPGDYTAIMIDPQRVTPEIYRHKNTVRTTGLFPRKGPVNTRFLFNIDDPGQSTVVFMPLVNWTRENGVMPGVALHNGFPLPKPVEYFATPFYSFKNQSLAGSGLLVFNITPYDKFIRLSTITLEGTRFGAPGEQNYGRGFASLDLYSNPASSARGLSHRVFANFITASRLFEIISHEKADMAFFTQMGYGLDRNSQVNPFDFLTILEMHRSYQKASVEFNYEYSYYGRGNGLFLRLFAGTMLKKDHAVEFHSFSAAARGGRELYLYGGNFPDRFSPFSTTFFSRQMVFSEGGLVSPVNETMGYSSRLVSLSLSSTWPGLPAWVPVRPFAGILLNESARTPGPHSPLFYEAGLKTGLWGLFEVYFPFLVSDNIRSVTGSFQDRIRFVLLLQPFNRLDFLGIFDND
jgi:hypothetical protein